MSELSAVSHPLYTVNCDFSGVPTATAEFLYFTGSLDPNDGTHYTTYQLVDGQNAVYENSLTYTYTPSNATGLYACNADAVFNAVINSTANTQTTSSGESSVCLTQHDQSILEVLE